MDKIITNNLIDNIYLLQKDKGNIIHTIEKKK